MISSEGRPAFLHGLWRCGSTYVWTRFREAEGTYCYYEPLHHGLARLTRERLTRETTSGQAALAHPDMDQPYFHEFLPLLTRRGVRDYRPALAWERFALAPSESHDRLQNYINTLKHFAIHQKKTPVFGFNRTGLRMGWLKKNFPSFNVHIDRDPRAIWASYERQKEKGNYTFFTTWLMIAENNADHPVFAPLAERLKLRRGIEKILRKPKSFYHDAVNDMSPEETYETVFYVWMACALHALVHADLVLDMNRMEESGYAADRARWVKQGCGLDIDFSDARVVPAEITRENADFEQVESEVLSFFPVNAPDFFDAAAVAARLRELASRKAGLLERVLRSKVGA